jgi:predicted ArsR family transcriptional regulator
VLRQLLVTNGVLTNTDVQEALGIDAAAAREWLQQLVADGLARVEGQRRGTRYVRIK